jgi:RNA polymerase sigma factor (sigma-70 family)
MTAALPVALHPWSLADQKSARVTRVGEPVRGENRVDDLRLIRGTLRGRREDFGTLVERHQQPLYGFVFRQVGDADAADDVVQTTFARAYAALRTFRGDASFKTWLHQIALNECRARFRRDRQRREVSLDEAADVAAPAGDAADAADRSALLANIERLPPRQRNVLMLRVFGDLPFKEIARLERTSEGSAKVSYHHAVKRLREWMS